ncbi:MAG: sigma-70 family RNA polymerase sigma factor [Labilithrix sp.]|nr:sigma-70 family RNA polymerase sigma factor [Labilithrix sp.]MCW5814249.1 sigma-70 family RNA polymerase sigma factor [Labilithrix sp.]
MTAFPETIPTWLRNPAIMAGYFRDPAQTAAAIDDEGWLHTGDVVREEDGVFTFVSRKKDMLRRRGENIAAAEIEDVLAAYPGVVEAAVVGVPSELGEDDIVAYLVLAPGTPHDEAALVAPTRTMGASGREQRGERVEARGAGVPLVLLAADERDDGGERADAVPRGDRGVGVGVDREDLHAGALPRGELLDDRFEHAAGAAPRRPEVEEDRDRGPEDLTLEGLCRDERDLAHAETGRERAASFMKARCKIGGAWHLCLVRAMEPLDALTDFIRAHRGDVVSAARREGLSAEDAVECAQEAFATHLQLLHRGDAPVRAAEWLPYVTTIARNTARNRRRRHHVARPHEAEHDTASEAASPEDLVAAAEEHVRLHACVERLCGTQRSVVMLRLLEERAGEDVAAELGITRGYVDVLLHRAKASLRECLTE